MPVAPAEDIPLAADHGDHYFRPSVLKRSTKRLSGENNLSTLALKSHEQFLLIPRLKKVSPSLIIIPI